MGQNLFGPARKSSKELSQEDIRSEPSYLIEPVLTRSSFHELKETHKTPSSTPRYLKVAAGIGALIFLRRAVIVGIEEAALIIERLAIATRGVILIPLALGAHTMWNKITKDTEDKGAPRFSKLRMQASAIGGSLSAIVGGGMTVFTGVCLYDKLFTADPTIHGPSYAVFGVGAACFFKLSAVLFRRARSIERTEIRR